MISFKTTVTLTPDVIIQIRDKVISHTMKSLILRNDIDTHLLNVIDGDLRRAFNSLEQENKPLTKDDIHLSSEQTLDIAEFLNRGKKIYAIKAFRSATGKGLKETKDFLDKFGLGYGGSELFLKMFT